jgi:hypothetical protein
MGWFGGGCRGGAVAIFDVASFRAAYPAFATNPPDATLQMYFALAGEVWLRNDGTGPVRTVALQTALMNMLVAHLTQLFSGPDGNDPSGLVGRIASATEGSVTVSTEYQSTMNSAWFDQTPYGAAFWQATAAFRSFPAYRRGPTRFGNGIGRGRGCSGGGYGGGGCIGSF